MKNVDSEPPDKRKKNNRNIPLLQLIPQTLENRYFYENGLSKIIPRLSLKVNSHIEDCYWLWNRFSINKSLFNLWDFRYSWYQGYGYRPYFYTLYEKKKPLAVLPLWFDNKYKLFEWFGGNWPEDNHFFYEDEKLLPLLFKIAPSPITLYAILPESLDLSEKNYPLKEDSPKFIRNVKGFNSIDSFLNLLEKKARSHLKHDFKKIEEYGPRIIINENVKENSLEELKQMSIRRFNGISKDSSSYEEVERLKTFQQVIKNQGVYQMIILEVKIQNHMAVVDIIGVYKDQFYLLTGANDIYRFPGIGNYVTYVEFEEAIKRKMALVDALQIDYNWKHRYFTQKRLLKFKKA